MARILVIDDSETVYLTVRNALMKDGHTVERLELLVRLPGLMRRDPPDLILLDLNMPMLSGASVGEFVRSYETRPTRLIIYSSDTLEEMTRVQKRLGADAVLSKGVSPLNLRGVVNRVLAVPTAA